MHRLFTILIGALLLGMASAVELPTTGAVVLVSAEGSVVGAGEFEDGNLELELLAGFSGFATLTAVDESGNEVSAEVMIDSNSSVVFTETLEDLEDVVASRGGELTVRSEERVEASGNMAFGAAVPDHVELPEVAREGMEQAAERHAEAKERAESAVSNGASASAEAEARAGARGEASGNRDGSAGGAEADAEAEAGAGAGAGHRPDGSGASGEAEAGASVGVGVGVGD